MGTPYITETGFLKKINYRVSPNGTSPIVTLEERIVMAKSSMVASTIPKSPICHGNRDASLGWGGLVLV